MVAGPKDLLRTRVGVVTSARRLIWANGKCDDSTGCTALSHWPHPLKSLTSGGVRVRFRLSWSFTVDREHSAHSCGEMLNLCRMLSSFATSQ